MTIKEIVIMLRNKEINSYEKFEMMLDESEEFSSRLCWELIQELLSSGQVEKEYQHHMHFCKEKPCPIQDKGIVNMLNNASKIEYPFDDVIMIKEEPQQEEFCNNGACNGGTGECYKRGGGSGGGSGGGVFMTRGGAGSGNLIEKNLKPQEEDSIEELEYNELYLPDHIIDRINQIIKHLNNK